MDDKTLLHKHSTDDEDYTVRILKRKILRRFIFVFSIPLIVIIFLGMVSYNLSNEVENIESLQDIILREIFYEKGKSYAHIIKGYEKLEKNGSFSSLMASRIASLYFERNTGDDRKHAFNILDKAKKSFADKWEIYQTLCAFYTLLNMEDDSIKNCEKAIELDPDDHQSYNNVAWIYAHAKNKDVNDIDKALRYAEKAVKLT